MNIELLSIQENGPSHL